jgi:HD-like signal output (HDOD) protein
MYKTLQELISSTSELAALPATTIKLLELLDEPAVEAGRVLKIIDKDPSLTANLLKLCNSAYYGVRRQVGSVKEALILLGNQTVVTLAFATSMGDILRGQLSAYGLAKDEMWHHALATALGAARLAECSDHADMKDRAFTAGLVHDIGKLLLNGPLTQQLEQLPPGAQGQTLLGAERRILGFDHCEAGAALATAWHFPPILALAILHHHRPDSAPEHAELTRAVYAANLIAESLGLGAGGATPVSLEEQEDLIRLGFPEEAVVELSGGLGRELEELLSVLGQPV